MADQHISDRELLLQAQKELDTANRLADDGQSGSDAWWDAVDLALQAHRELSRRLGHPTPSQETLDALDETEARVQALLDLVARNAEFRVDGDREDDSKRDEPHG